MPSSLRAPGRSATAVLVLTALLAITTPLPASAGSRADCNTNGIDDTEDIGNGTSGDCDGNGVPDECDIAECTGDPACEDANSDGILDVCGVAQTAFAWVLVGDAGNSADGCRLRFRFLRLSDHQIRSHQRPVY